MKVLIYKKDSSSVTNLVKVVKNLGHKPILVSDDDILRQAIFRKEVDILIIEACWRRLISQIERLNKEIPLILMIPEDGVFVGGDLITSNTVAILTDTGSTLSFRRAFNMAISRRKRNLVIQNSVESLRKKVKELEILNEIVRAINSSLRLDEIIQIIMEKTADLIKAEGWSVLLLDEEKKELVFKAAAGEAGKKLIGMRLKLGQGIAGWVARSGKSLIVSDVSKDPRFYSGVDKKTKFTTKSILCVPMKSRNKIIGVVEVVNKIGGDPFTEDDLRIFENLVEHVTIALLNARLYEQMERAIVTDDLTRLYNTRYCNKILDEFIKKEKAGKRKISLIFLDVDYFKLVDDNYGHLVGSNTLKLIGERIKQVVRKDDVVVRYGGDEYIVVLPDTGKKIAGIVAERIRKAVNNSPFTAPRNKKFFISVTLGVATYPDDARTRDQLIGKADKAMYEGKMTGR
ncbi:MAG: sensor domain-containing diguanylate cyclase, partial [candidate division WOR-3 bacterium]